MKSTRKHPETVRNNRIQSRFRKFALRVLGCIVVFVTTYSLILPAITLEGRTFCGLEEHSHSDACWKDVLVCGLEETEGHSHTEDCYGEVLVCGEEERAGHAHTDACWEDVPVCGLEDDEEHVHTGDCFKRQLVCGLEETNGHIHSADCYARDLVCGLAEGEGSHVHGEDCYERQLACGLAEHEHTLACFADPDADVESRSQWERTLPRELTDDPVENLTAVAMSQVGYHESERNYTVPEDGSAVRGYTRYGAFRTWYTGVSGYEYEDWSGDFAAFCLYYAGVPEDTLPLRWSASDWRDELNGRDMYVRPEDHTPAPGDLVFLRDEEPEADEPAEHIGVVTDLRLDGNGGVRSLYAVIGDYADRVWYEEIPVDSERITGYGVLPADMIASVRVPEAVQVGEPEVMEEPERELSAAAGDYDVSLFYREDAGIPADARLDVTEYAEDSEEYAQARQAVVDHKAASEEDFDEENLGFAALDITLRDGDGGVIEPGATVRVSIRMKTPEDIPAEALQETLEVQHLVEDGDALAVQETVNAASPENEGAVEADASETTATIAVDSLSPFTITWRHDYNKTVTFNLSFKDTDGNELAASESYQKQISNNQWVELTGPEYAIPIDGYVLEKVLWNNQEITKFQGRSGDSIAYFYNGDTQVGSLDMWYTPSTDIQLIYSKVNSDDPGGDTPGGGGTGGGTGSGGELNLDDLPAAQASKTLTPNHDGTYTLTLSMQVPKLENQSSNRANIVIIYDSSNSMHLPVPGNEWVRDDQHGTYAEYNGKYYQLSSFGSDIRRVFSFQDDTGTTHSLGADQKNNGVFCGPKYLPTYTRMDVAEAAVKNLAEKLLNNNTEDDPTKVELAFVEFASDIKQVQQPTTSLGTFNGWVNNCSIPMVPTQNAADLMGGTNWDAALRVASGNAYPGHDDVVQFSDDDPVYIIFVSDGNPTARTTEEGDDGTRIGSSGLFGSEIPGVYGTGNSDTQNYNYNCAVAQAQRIIDTDNVTLYNVGIFGDADKMASLPNDGYFDGTDETGIRNAFNSIVGQVTSRLGYTNLSIIDGITSMTSTALTKKPDDFMYKVTDENGQDVTDEVLPMAKRNAEYHVSSEDNESGYVTWDLGADELLLEGGTYSLSFIVWPDQDTYNLVADLNNGTRQWADLNDEERAQVFSNGGEYTLKTNTRQSITYSPAQEVIRDNGQPEITYYDSKTAPLETPEPVELTDTTINIQKVWDVDLDPSELTEFLDNYKEEHDGSSFQAHLNLWQKGTADPYIEDIVISQPANPLARNADGVIAWPGPTEQHISVGLMVSAGKAAESGLTVQDGEGHDIYDTRMFNGTKYYILEKGYDYYFEETGLDDVHFELEPKVFHPMVVDGEKKDVTFNSDGSIASIENLSTLSAANQLRGGLNIEKKIVDAHGDEITSDTTSVFTIHGSITLNGEPVALEYRYYGDKYPGGRSGKMSLSNSADFTLEVRVGETLRIVNVPQGCQYSFYEVTSEGEKLYSFVSIEGSNTTKDAAGNVIPADSSMISVGTQTVDGKEVSVLSGTTIPNASQLITVKNTPRPVHLKLVKTDNDTGTKPLPNAEFSLYTELNEDGTGKTKAKDLDGVDIGKVTTDAEGIATISNLAPGTYYLLEEKPPTGYAPCKGPIEVLIGREGVSYDQPGNAASAAAGFLTPVENADKSLTYTLTITNALEGKALPSTGGAGTSPYRAAGIALLGLTALLFGYTARRRTEERRKRRTAPRG